MPTKTRRPAPKGLKTKKTKTTSRARKGTAATRRRAPTTAA